MHFAQVTNGETDLDWSIKLQLWLEKVHRHQFIVKSFGSLEVGFGDLFQGILFGGKKFNIDSFPHVLHRLTEHGIAHQLQQVLSDLVPYPYYLFPLANVQFDVQLEPGLLLELDDAMNLC